MQQMFRVEDREASYLMGCVGSGPFETAFDWTERVWQTLLQNDREYLGPFITANHPRQTEFTMYAGREYQAPPETVDNHMVTIHLPAQQYAVGRVQGDQSAVYDCYLKLREWIGHQDRQENLSALGLEIYPSSPIPRTGALDFEIWLPLVNRIEPTAE